MNSIEIKDLSIGYDAHSKKIKTVASQLNGRLNEGRLTCLLGANGVGKSTLLKTLSGFLPKLQGNILIGNKDIEDYSDKELAKLIGVVLTAKPEIQNMSAKMAASVRMRLSSSWVLARTSSIRWRSFSRYSATVLGLMGVVGVLCFRTRQTLRTLQSHLLSDLSDLSDSSDFNSLTC